MENKFTLIAGGLIAAAILTAVIYYSVTKTVYTNSLNNPTIDDYENIRNTYKGKLVGGVYCKCSQTVLPWGTEAGGFIESASFKLDPICDGYNVSLASIHSTFDAMSLAKVGGGGPPSKVWGCKDLSTYNSGLVSPSVSLIPEADCAVTQAISEKLLDDLNTICKTADTVNQIVKDSWMTTSFLTPSMMSELHLKKFVQTKLDEMAVQNGIRLFVSTDKGKVAGISEQQTAAEFRTAAGVTSSSSLVELTEACADFRLGDTAPNISEAPHLNLLAGVIECAGFDSANYSAGGRRLATPPGAEKPGKQASVKAHCCNRTKKVTLCDAPVKLPCSPHMIELGRRLAMSSYATVTDAIKGAFLSGNSETERATRNKAKGIHPGPKSGSVRGQLVNAAAAAPNNKGGRRLAEAGGFEASGTSNENFRKYFDACQPSECTYIVTDTPDASRLGLIIAGLVGGIITAGKGAGLVLLFISKKAVFQHLKQKVEDDVTDFSSSKDAMGAKPSLGDMALED